MHHVAARILDALLDDRAVAVAVREPRGEYLAERRILLKRGDVFFLDLPLLDPAPDLLGQLGGQHPLLLQRPHTFKNDRGGDDRGEDDRPHHDAAGFDDFEHDSRALSRCLREY